MLHERIQILQKELKLSQRQMALTAHINPGYFSQIIRGEVIPSDKILLSIETTFNVNPPWLRDGAGDIFKDPNLSDLKREIIEKIETLDDNQVDAVLTFLDFLNKKKA